MHYYVNVNDNNAHSHTPSMYVCRWSFGVVLWEIVTYGKPIKQTVGVVINHDGLFSRSCISVL